MKCNIQLHLSPQTETNSSSTTSLQVYSTLAELRKQQPSFVYGKISFTYADDSILSYVRYAQDYPAFMVVMNLGQSLVTLDLSGSPVNQGQGEVKVVNAKAANEGRFQIGAEVNLKSLSLDLGDALVIQLKSLSV